jgi:hypothetical protein
MFISPLLMIVEKYYSKALVKLFPSNIFSHSDSVTYSKIASPIVPASNNSDGEEVGLVNKGKWNSS